MKPDFLIVIFYKDVVLFKGEQQEWWRGGVSGKVRCQGERYSPDKATID